jgi:hypothetical protein
MAPAPKLPHDNAVDILHRLEPMLANIQAELKETSFEQRRQGEALARLDGRVSELPTIWHVVGAVLAINACIMTLGFALANL